jgi:hypothetical protein
MAGQDSRTCGGSYILFADARIDAFTPAHRDQKSLTEPETGPFISVTRRQQEAGELMASVDLMWRSST